MSEQRQITAKGKKIAYIFTRKKVKNLNLRIRNDGSVHVSAPMRTPLSRVDAFVREHAALIFNAQERVKQYHSLRAMVDGDTVYFLGEPYLLTLREGPPSLVFREGRAYLTLPNPGENLEEAYLSLAGDEILPLLKERCASLEAAFPRLAGKAKEIRVRFMKSMWANCRPSVGRLTFSASLATMPIPLIDGVIAHEYAHFFHSGHGADFYAFLFTISPDYKELSLALKHTKRKQLAQKY